MVCIAVDWYRQNRPASSIGTTAAEATARFGRTLPFDHWRTVFGAALHDSAVMYPFSLAPAVVMLTRAEVAPNGASVVTTTRVFAPGTSVCAKQRVVMLPFVSATWKQLPVGAGAGAAPRLNARIAFACSTVPLNSKCMGSRLADDFTCAGDEQPLLQP